DGKLLATGGQNSTVLIWPVARRPNPPALTISDRRQATLWTDLAGADAKRAFEALKTLSAAPVATVTVLRRHLHPVAAPDTDRLQRWIAELDSDTFSVREQATEKLVDIHELAEPQVRLVLRGRPSLELRRRVEGLLEKLSVEPPERLPMLRVLEVLERLNTAE